MSAKRWGLVFAMALAGLLAPMGARADNAEEQAVQALRKLDAYVAGDGDRAPEARPITIVRFPVGKPPTEEALALLSRFKKLSENPKNRHHSGEISVGFGVLG